MKLLGTKGEGRVKEEKKLYGIKLCGRWVQKAAVVDNEDLRGDVAFFWSLFWDFLTVAVIAKELFLVALNDKKKGTEKNAL